MLLAVVITCYVIGLGAELAGIVLVVLEALSAQRALVRYLQRARPPLSPVQEVFRRRSPELAHERQDADDVAVRQLLDSRARWRLAVALLLVGVVAGAVGNFASLGL